MHRDNDKNTIDMIMIPFHDYAKWHKEGFRTRDAHLFREFQKNGRVNKVLLVNRPVSLLEMIFRRRSWRTTSGEIVLREKNWQLVRIDEKSYCLDFFQKDFLRVLILRKRWWDVVFRRRDIWKAILQVEDYLKFNRAVLFLENPMAVGVVGNIGEELLVFDAIDNWLYHPQMQMIKSMVEKNYQFIKRRANIIITVSQDLKRFFEAPIHPTYQINNGVEIKEFMKGFAESKEMVEDIRVGYIGKIQERINFKLVEQCLKKFPRNKFVFYGPILSCKKEVKRLIREYKNAIFEGDVQYDILPKKMKEFDVAIIPHEVNEFTESMNPIKIYEYLAAGKQVVTTNVAGVSGVSDYVYRADNDKDFIRQLETSMAKATKRGLPEKVKKSLDERYDWKNIADDILQIICEYSRSRKYEK